MDSENAISGRQQGKAAVQGNKRRYTIQLLLLLTSNTLQLSAEPQMSSIRLVQGPW